MKKSKLCIFYILYIHLSHLVWGGGGLILRSADREEDAVGQADLEERSPWLRGPFGCLNESSDGAHSPFLALPHGKKVLKTSRSRDSGRGEVGCESLGPYFVIEVCFSLFKKNAKEI
ncbi:hypothetical protein E2320_000284 [Naja naja]|nr:hypothetical protein E2320_000284 [Naja naja]